MSARPDQPPSVPTSNPSRLPWFLPLLLMPFTLGWEPTQVIGSLIVLIPILVILVVLVPSRA